MCNFCLLGSRCVIWFPIRIYWSLTRRSGSLPNPQYLGGKLYLLSYSTSAVADDLAEVRELVQQPLPSRHLPDLLQPHRCDARYRASPRAQPSHAAWLSTSIACGARRMRKGRGSIRRDEDSAGEFAKCRGVEPTVGPDIQSQTIWNWSGGVCHFSGQTWIRFPMMKCVYHICPTVLSTVPAK